MNFPKVFYFNCKLFLKGLLKILMVEGYQDRRHQWSTRPAHNPSLSWSTPKHQPKHKLEKWFIISGDSVCPYIRTYKTHRSKSSTIFQASALVSAWAWIIVRLKSCSLFFKFWDVRKDGQHVWKYLSQPAVTVGLDQKYYFDHGIIFSTFLFWVRICFILVKLSFEIIFT